MKGLRRSLGKERTSNTSNNNSQYASLSPPLPGQYRTAPQATLPPSNNSKLPPTKIIRAIHTYRSRAPQELSFQKGDFFHVVGERRPSGASDESWYDASNPATGARGLVPMSFFEELGRSTNDSARRSQSKATLSESSSLPASMPPLPASTPSDAASLQRIAPQPKTPNLYGRVLYDFDAERQDELDAKKGEHIIVIAQSNHEWFVAKPIGRLGGPGLIPASYVEIMNMATGKAIDQETVAEMVRGGALPPVEEWKKSTAEYKQASIPLGRFDFGPTAANTTQINNFGNGHTRQPSNTNAAPRQANSSYEPTANGQLQSYADAPGSQSAPLLSQSQISPPPSQTQFADGGDLPLDPDELLAKYGILSKASVESFHHEEGSFWFHMRCTLTSDYALVLYRLYEDFYDFQMALKEAFPVEAGLAPARPGEPTRRILPLMPGPTDDVDEVVCAERVVDLTKYLSELCRLPDYVRKHPLFFEFLLPRPGDMEIAQPRAGFAQSGRDEAENEILGYLDQMPGSQGSSGLERGVDQLRLSSRMDPRPESRTSARSHASYTSNAASYQQQQPSNRGSNSYNNGFAQPEPPNSYNERHSNKHSSGGSSGAAAATRAAAAANAGFVKIKIFHRRTEDVIAIRVPPNVTRQALVAKTRERLGEDLSRLMYRDDRNPGLLLELFGDEDLDRWLGSGAKLVLYAE